MIAYIISAKRGYLTIEKPQGNEYHKQAYIY
jgi:hypothetical protein